MNSADLSLPDASYHRALLFFLLHEQPNFIADEYPQRGLPHRQTGRAVASCCDYALPRWWHPLRYLWRPLLAALRAFRADPWRHEIAPLAAGGRAASMSKQSLFGGLYRNRRPRTEEMAGAESARLPAMQTMFVAKSNRNQRAGGDGSVMRPCHQRGLDCDAASQPEIMGGHAQTMRSMPG